jgi:hypothetical protein
MPATPCISRASDPVPEVVAPAPVSHRSRRYHQPPGGSRALSVSTLSATDSLPLTALELQMPQPGLDDIAISRLNRNREVSNVAINGLCRSWLFQSI